jgi:sporulation protein YlmC with PRC-barrel domain
MHEMTSTRVKVSDTNLTLVDWAEGIQGWDILATVGKEIGEVDDLLVDEQGHKVCFLQVSSWRFLGLGATKSFDASGRGLN